MSERGTGQRMPERVMSLEDVFLSREFGRIRGLAPADRSGVQAVRNPGPGRESRMGSSGARGGSAPTSAAARLRSRTGAPTVEGEPVASSTASAASTTEGTPGNAGRPADLTDLTHSLRTDPGQTTASAPGPHPAASGPTLPAPAPAPTTPATPSSVAPAAPSPSPAPSGGPAPVGGLVDTFVTATDGAVSGIVATLDSAAPAVTSVLGSLPGSSSTSA